MATPVEELKYRLVRKMKEKNIAPIELSKKTGIPKSSISQYMSGFVTPKADRVYQIASVLGVSEAWLLGFDVSETDNFDITPAAVKIPVLGTVSAGIPLSAVENIIDYEEISQEMASTGEYFCLKIKGQSMEPKISDGDVVVIRKQSDVESGDIAIVLINGGEATVKKVKKQPDGIVLLPNNPAYDIKYYSNSDINTLPVTILGKVVELRAKF